MLTCCAARPTRGEPRSARAVAGDRKMPWAPRRAGLGLEGGPLTARRVCAGAMHPLLLFLLFALVAPATMCYLTTVHANNRAHRNNIGQAITWGQTATPHAGPYSFRTVVCANPLVLRNQYWASANRPTDQFNGVDFVIFLTEACLKKDKHKVDIEAAIAVNERGIATGVTANHQFTVLKPSDPRYVQWPVGRRTHCPSLTHPPAAPSRSSSRRARRSTSRISTRRSASR
jgi:hypothetical protein